MGRRIIEAEPEPPQEEELQDNEIETAEDETIAEGCEHCGCTEVDENTGEQLHWETCPIMIGEIAPEEAASEDDDTDDEEYVDSAEDAGPTDEELAAEEEALAEEEEAPEPEVEVTQPKRASKPARLPVRRNEPAEEAFAEEIAKPSTALTRRPSMAIRKASHDSVPRALLTEGRNDLQRIITENLGVGQLSLGDLTRIKMPSGGQLQFEIPSVVSDQPKYTPQIEGVIIAHRLGRSFWWESIDKTGGGSPPDCMSHDMKHGLGNPVNDDNQPSKDNLGYLCETCAWNQWGSGSEDGDPNGPKACKEIHFLFIMEGKSQLPKVLVVPPTSLKPVKQYMLGMVNENYAFHQVITRISLKKSTSKKNITYGELVLTMAAELNDDEAVAAASMSAAITPLIRQMASTVTEAPE